MIIIALRRVFVKHSGKISAFFTTERHQNGKTLTHTQKSGKSRFSVLKNLRNLQIQSKVSAQGFFQVDQLFGDILALFIRRFILVQVAIQCFHAHIAAVGNQVCHRLIRLVKRHFHAGFHMRHALCHHRRFFAVVMIAFKKRTDLVF